MMKSKALNLTVSTALLLSMAAVAGCGNTNDGNTTRTNSVDTGRIGVNSVRNNQNAGTTRQHDLTNLKYSKTLSDKVSDISGVGRAHVFVTNRNAYVSLSRNGMNTINDTNTSSNNGRVTGMSTGANRNSTNGTMTGNGTTNVRNRTFGTSGTGSVGILRGMANDTRRGVENTTGLGRNADNRGFGVNGTTNGGFGGGNFNTLNGNRTNGLMGTNGTGLGTNGTRTNGLMGTNGTGTTSMGTNNTLGGTNGATDNTFIGTGINGVPYGTYSNNNMGMMSTNREEVPEHVRQEITSKIRKTAPHISQVYVSTDDDFYQHANGFANGDNANNTLGTLSRDFGSWINRVFPLNLGGRDGMNDTRGNLMKNDTDDGWFGGNRNSR
ncbi:sporulation protein [Bacillus sp. FJAT-18019]|nr:sporulation protein [Bacillus sp. FJAT-18019]